MLVLESNLIPVRARRTRGLNTRDSGMLSARWGPGNRESSSTHMLACLQVCMEAGLQDRTYTLLPECQLAC